MTGEELIKFVPDSLGFFAIDNYGGVIDRDHQAWIFEGDDAFPHPITRSEVLERDGYQCSSDEAAEHIGQHPGAIEFLESLEELRLKKNDRSSTDLTKQETRAASSKMKVRVAPNRIMEIRTRL